MNTWPRPTLQSLQHDLFTSLILLAISLVGGCLALHTHQMSGVDTLHARLFLILLIQPLALMAWLFCGLPGLGLAVKSLFTALEMRKTLAGLASTGLLALSLATTMLWF